MKKRTHTLHGIECIHIANKTLSLTLTTSIGPRVLSLTPAGGNNLFVDLPEVILDCPGVGSYHLYGGHRLWHSPENSRRTYIPDSLPVSVENIDNGVILTQPVESDTQIQKSMQITLHDAMPIVAVDHTLTNKGLWPVELAPWAITMMKPGGFAILPQNRERTDPDGLLPNRQLVLWPYSNLNIKNLVWGHDALFLHAPLDEGAFKIGFPNPRGWIAYFNPPYLFVKRSVFQTDKTYPDNGCSSECYCNPQFLELETLGPLVSLQPGRMINHREIWEVHTIPDFEPDDSSLNRLDKPME